MSVLQSLRLFFRRLFALGGSDFLCDRCKYNHPNTCSIRERPNVRSCSDFKSK